MKTRGQKTDTSQIHDLPPPLQDRAVAFFIHQYVSGTFDSSASVQRRGIHEYLPDLLQQARDKGPLGTITAAAGLAALANVGKSTGWKSQAYGLYGTAICQLQAHLSDPDRMRSDETLGAIMLMSIFEVGFAHLQRRLNPSTADILPGHCLCRHGLNEVI